MAHSTFSTNSACLGGAIANSYDGSGTATITGSTFLDNSAICQGGAIANANHGSGRLSVTDSTFSGNRAPDGGAIENGDGGTGTTTITGSTFSGNSASDDGTAIDNGDTGGKGSTVVVGADIIAGFCNQLSGTWTDLGHNVAFSDSCFKGGREDVADTNVGSQLGPLADNGGATQTMILLSGNPASGLLANPTGNGLCPVAADQTGQPSPTGAPCNAGALQPHPAIHAVTFSGAADAQVVTVTGCGFGTKANLGPPTTPCSSPKTGEDYGAALLLHQRNREVDRRQRCLAQLRLRRTGDHVVQQHHRRLRFRVELLHLLHVPQEERVRHVPAGSDLLRQVVRSATPRPHGPARSRSGVPGS